jgi:gluconate 2-dehydrogenase gamma chain
MHDDPSEAPPKLDEPSRRVFLKRATLAAGGVVLVGACKQGEAPPKGPPPAATAPLTTHHLTMTDPEFAVLSAAVDRVLPRDEDVGALDAGVPEYIDRALTTHALAEKREGFVSGLAALDRASKRRFKVGFVEATAPQRDEVLTVFKNGKQGSGEARFWELLIALTFEGFLGDPSYGGNRDQVGWKMLGFSLVDHTPADPSGAYDGVKKLEALKCGGGKGC